MQKDVLRPQHTDKRIPPRILPVLGGILGGIFSLYSSDPVLRANLHTAAELRFFCAAGAVEKFATDGTVSVVYLRDSIGISKINAAFLTGQQIGRIHV